MDRDPFVFVGTLFVTLFTFSLSYSLEAAKYGFRHVLDPIISHADVRRKCTHRSGSRGVKRLTRVSRNLPQERRLMVRTYAVASPISVERNTAQDFCINFTSKNPVASRPLLWSCAERVSVEGVRLEWNIFGWFLEDFEFILVFLHAFRVFFLKIFKNTYKTVPFKADTF